MSTRISQTQLEGVLHAVTVLGGHPERIFGGFLTVYLPEDCTYDPEHALDEDLRPGEPSVAQPPGNAV